MQRSTSKLFSKLSTASINCYKGNELTLEETKKLLTKFKGGNIIVSKNDVTGIATICLNRPDKKNAISGKNMKNKKLNNTNLNDFLNFFSFSRTNVN